MTKKTREEGHYTIKRVDKLPKKGNENLLYIIKGGSISELHRALPNGEYETISIGKEGSTYTLSPIEGKSFDLIENGVPVSTVSLSEFPQFTDLFIGNAVLEGGVIYDSTTDTYFVWANKYIIDGTFYNTPVNGYIDLPEGDGINGRIDVFYIENDGVTTPSVGFEQGVADGNLVKPSVDLSTQVEVGLKIVETGETTPSDISDILVFDENVGSPAEFNITTAISGGNPSDNIDPFNGVLSYNIPNTGLLSFTSISPITISSTTKLVFAFKTESSWSGSTRLRISIEDTGSSEVSSTININRSNGTLYNFVHTNINVWQVISINVSDFGLISTNVDKINYEFVNTPNVHLDRVFIQGGLSNSVTPSYNSRPKDRILIDNAVSGTFIIDYDLYEIFDLTLVGPTVFDEINVHPKTLVLGVTGDVSITYADGWGTNLEGEYVGTKNNLFAIQNFAPLKYKVQIS